MANSPVYELLLRNEERFVDKNLLIVGDILDPAILNFAKRTKHSTLICDNFVVASQMAAMLGLELTHDFPQELSIAHVRLIFGSIEELNSIDKSFDTLLLLIAKNKQQNRKLLAHATKKLDDKAMIYTAGSNDGGGKSADTLLKPLGKTYKIDLARKCTMFEACFENNVASFDNPPSLKLDLFNHKLELMQDTAVFSQGKLDLGTKLLLEAVKDLAPHGSVLDLGCGCGIVGCFLAKLGFLDITCTDISASALKLTEQNLIKNEAKAKLQASDMLRELQKFDFIVVNPPFHVGVNTTTAATVNMILEAREHLNKNGELYMVANSHLGYEKYLVQSFETVEIVLKNNSFVVYKAS